MDGSFASSKLFQGIDGPTIERLSRIPELVTIEPSTVIFDEGDAGDDFYLISNGVIRISKRGRGGQQETLSYLAVGDHFGEMALFDPAPRSARATVVEGSVLGRIDRPRLESMLAIAPIQLHFNLSIETIRRLREADRFLIDELISSERLSMIGSMAAMMIHDLKNPIAGIQFATELLAREASGSTTITRLTSLITRSLDGMQDMMQDLLAFSRGRNELRMESIDIARIDAELEEQGFRWLSAKGIMVEREILASGEVRVDPGRFLRALLNIVRNAGDVMHDGGVLRLRICREDGFVLFALEDNGPGIPEDFLPRIFEPFVTHGKPLGTGLGLTVAKSVIEAHGGTISVSTARGRGTTFVVRIPDYEDTKVGS